MGAAPGWAASQFWCVVELIFPTFPLENSNLNVFHLHRPNTNRVTGPIPLYELITEPAQIV